jgi:hypothetical protein
MKRTLLILSILGFISCKNETKSPKNLNESSTEDETQTESNWNLYYAPVKLELAQALEDDQKYRQQLDTVAAKYGRKSKEIDNLWKIIKEKDSINILKIQAILDKYGWIGEDKIGEAANETLFYVVQHADLKIQQKYLPMMREAVKKNNAKKKNLAYLEDRVRLGEGKKQLYGSQLLLDEKTGEYYPESLEDPGNVDKRRAEMQLGPIAEYTSSVGNYKKEVRLKIKKDKMRIPFR